MFVPDRRHTLSRLFANTSFVTAAVVELQNRPNVVEPYGPSEKQCLTAKLRSTRPSLPESTFAPAANSATDLGPSRSWSAILALIATRKHA